MNIILDFTANVKRKAGKRKKNCGFSRNFHFFSEKAKTRRPGKKLLSKAVEGVLWFCLGNAFGAAIEETPNAFGDYSATQNHLNQILRTQGSVWYTPLAVRR